MSARRQTPPLTKDERQALEKAIGHRFRKVEHLWTALTHRSWHYDEQRRLDREDGGEKAAPSHNERYEFLGDAVLDLVVAEALFALYPDKTEGELSKIRAALVQEKTLAKLAREIGLDQAVLLGAGEESAGGRRKASILADTYEALLAAIYLDAGMKKADKVIRAQFTEFLKCPEAAGRVSDYKTLLQEFTQARWKAVPDYTLREASGPDHRKTFEVECRLNGEVLGVGRAASKKAAGQVAAKEALERLRAETRHVEAEGDAQQS